MTINPKTYDPYEWMRAMANPETDACMRGLMADNARAAHRATVVDNKHYAEVATQRALAERRAAETNDGKGWAGYWNGSLSLEEWWNAEHPGEEYVPMVAAVARKADAQQRRAEWQRRQNRVGD